MRFTRRTQSIALGTVDGGRARDASGLPLHGDRDGPAVELDPRDLNRVHDPGGHVDEDRGPHANLEGPGSDDPGFLESPSPFVTSGRRDCSFWPTILMRENPGGQLMNSKLHGR